MLAAFLKEGWSDGYRRKVRTCLAETYALHRDPGDSLGFAATGKPMAVSGATIYYFDDRGRVTGHWQIVDRARHLPAGP